MKRKICELQGQQDNDNNNNNNNNVIINTPPAQAAVTEVPGAPVQEGVTFGRFDVDAPLPEGYVYADADEDENDESDAGRTSAEVSSDSDDGFDMDRLKLAENHHATGGIAVFHRNSGASSSSKVGAFSGASKARAEDLSSYDATTPSRGSSDYPSLPNISAKGRSANSNEGVASTNPERLFGDFRPTPVRAPSQEFSGHDPFSGISGKLGWFGEVEHTASTALDEDFNSECSVTPVRSPEGEAAIAEWHPENHQNQNVASPCPSSYECSPTPVRTPKDTAVAGAGRSSDYTKEISPNTWRELGEVLTSPAAKAGEAGAGSRSLLLQGYSIDQNVPDMDNLEILHHGARLEAYMDQSIENAFEASRILNEMLGDHPEYLLPPLMVALDWWFESVI